MTEYNGLSLYRGDLFDSLSRHGLGWDSFFKSLNTNLDSVVSSTNYPPYNIIELGEDQYEIELAVAGFNDSDLIIEVRENRLNISGSKKERSEGRNYRHQGLASRAFARSFLLPEHMEVTGASLKDGILTVSMRFILPDEKKPRLIPIKTGP